MQKLSNLLDELLIISSSFSNEEIEHRIRFSTGSVPFDNNCRFILTSYFNKIYYTKNLFSNDLF